MNLDVLGRDLGVISAWPEAELAASAAPYDGPVLWLTGCRSSHVQPAYDAAMDRWFPATAR